jgi:hypothetical protein
MSHTIFGYILSIGGGIAKREANPLLAEFFLRDCGLGRRLQKFGQFGIGCDISKKLLSICHSIHLFFDWSSERVRIGVIPIKPAMSIS